MSSISQYLCFVQRKRQKSVSRSLFGLRKRGIYNVQTQKGFITAPANYVNKQRKFENMKFPGVKAWTFSAFGQPRQIRRFHQPRMQAHL